VFVDGEGAETAAFTTVLNSTIVNSADVGILLNAGSSDVRLVGNTIGLVGEANSKGIEVAGGEQYVGASAILPNTAVPSLSVTPFAAGSKQASVAANATADLLQVGVGLYDAAAGRSWIITAKAYDAATTRYLLTLDGPAFTSTANVTIEAGNFVDAVARAKQLTLPAGFDASRLYLGQTVAAVTEGITAAGTVISGISEAGGVTTIDLSNELLDGGKTAILFGNPARNIVGFNEDGIVLSGGSAAVVATDVTRSVYDGIIIEGVDLNGPGHRLGGLGGENGVANTSPLVGQPAISTENLVITANGLVGIRFAEVFFEDLGVGLTAAQRYDATMASVAIVGNFLGTNAAGATGLTNGPDGASNIKVDDAEVSERMLVDATPDDNDPRDGDPNGRYSAPYRPEDSTTNDTLFRYFGYDRNGNFHGIGEPPDLPSDGGGSHGDGGTVRHPPRR